MGNAETDLIPGLPVPELNNTPSFTESLLNKTAYGVPPGWDLSLVNKNGSPMLAIRAARMVPDYHGNPIAIEPEATSPLPTTLVTGGPVTSPLMSSGMIMALDANNGNLLWQYNCGAQVGIGGPSIGNGYLLVPTGGGQENNNGGYVSPLACLVPLHRVLALPRPLPRRACGCR